MRFRGICQRVATLSRRLLQGRVEYRGQCQNLEAGSKISELHDQASGISAPMRFTTATTSTAHASPEKALGAGDVVRFLLGPNSVARISNILVVGREDSAPMKRMEMRFGDPEQVPVLFGLLASALTASGFTLKTSRQADIPPNEIRLTCPLGGEKKILLCCAAMMEEHVSPTIGVIPVMHEAGRDNRAPQL